MTGRETLLKVLESAESAIYWNSSDKGFIEKVADHLIANDVVPVVRCKDCKHCTVTSDGMVCENALPTKRMMDYYIYGSTILARVRAEDFCSYGERKGDGNV